MFDDGYLAKILPNNPHRTGGLTANSPKFHDINNFAKKKAREKGARRVKKRWARRKGARREEKARSATIRLSY